jgi:hypothetical protein
MAQLGKHFTASILGALVLGVTTPGPGQSKERDLAPARA